MNWEASLPDPLPSQCGGTIWAALGGGGPCSIPGRLLTAHGHCAFEETISCCILVASPGRFYSDYTPQTWLGISREGGKGCSSKLTASPSSAALPKDSSPVSPGLQCHSSTPRPLNTTQTHLLCHPSSCGELHPTGWCPGGAHKYLTTGVQDMQVRLS